MFSYSVVGAQLYIGDMLFVMISFLILMWLVKIFAWKPVVKMMKDRSDKIANDIDSAESSRTDAANLAQKRQTELASTRQEAGGIISKAKDNGQKQRDQIIEDAHSEVTTMKSTAQKDIEQQRQEALANSRKDVASLSVEIASKIIVKELNPDDQKALVDSYIEGWESKMAQDNLTSAKKYAKAINDILKENGNVDEGREEFLQLKQVFLDNPKLASVLNDTQTPAETKKSLLDAISANGSDLLKNFIKLADVYQHFADVPLIIDQFEKLYEADNKIVHADVISATELSDDQQSKIADAFAKRVGANKVVLNTSVDSDVLGGVVLKSDDITIDGSVRTRINKIKELLLN